jgi:hypothetical protein
MAAVSRLGPGGYSKAPYGSFAGKVPMVTPVMPLPETRVTVHRYTIPRFVIFLAVILAGLLLAGS